MLSERLQEESYMKQILARVEKEKDDGGDSTVVANLDKTVQSEPSKFVQATLSEDKQMI